MKAIARITYALTIFLMLGCARRPQETPEPFVAQFGDRGAHDDVNWIIYVDEHGDLWERLSKVNDNQIVNFRAKVDGAPVTIQLHVIDEANTPAATLSSVLARIEHREKRWTV